MTDEKIMDVFIRLRRIYNLLGEVQNLSQQMAESLDRDDNTAFGILLMMRREPLQELAENREQVQELLEEMPEDDALYLKAILNGGKGNSPLEIKMAEQAASNSRLLAQVQILDRRLSGKIAHEQSVYESVDS